MKTFRTSWPRARRLRSVRSEEGVQGWVWRTGAEGREQLGRGALAVRQLIPDVQPPCRDHREHEHPALAEQDLIDGRVAGGDVARNVREIELDGSATRRLEVDDPRTRRGVQDVSRMR